jgi:hypothetical protein
MITTGVPVRYPTSGGRHRGGHLVGAVPDAQDGQGVYRAPREVPFLTEKPSHYLKKMFFATQPVEEPENLRIS